MLLLLLFSEVGAGFQPFLTAWQDRAETKAYGLFRGNGTVFADRGSVNRDGLVVKVQGDASLFGRMLFLLLWREGVLLLPLALSWTDDLTILAVRKNRSGAETETSLKLRMADIVVLGSQGRLLLVSVE